MKELDIDLTKVLVTANSKNDTEYKNGFILNPIKTSLNSII